MKITKHWCCPNCNTTTVTKEQRPHTQFHNCLGLAGLVAPMIQDGINAKVVANERQDYIGKELVTCDANGRVVMSITTTRDDGEDCAVFAPTATASTEYK